MKSSPFLAGKRSLCRSSDHKDYAAFFTAISASQAGLAALIGIIRSAALTQSVFSPATRPLAARLSAGF
jgi:hypothetical protein